MIIGDGFGRIHAGEYDVIAEPWPRETGRFPVVYNHSAASDARELSGWSLPNTTKIAKCLTDKLRFPVTSASMFLTFGAAGLPAGSSVGLPTWRGRVEESIAAHQTLFGSSGDVGLCGISMGTTNSLIYALEHPTNVRWMVLFSPVPLLKEYELANTGGARAIIDTAWNVSSGALPSNADIYTRIMAGGLGSIPVLWIHSSDDGWTNGSFTTKFNQVVAATGGHRQALGAVGHGDGTTVNTDFAAVEDFIHTYSQPAPE